MNGYFNRYREELLNDQPKQRYVGIGVSVLWVVVLVGIGFVPAIRGAMSAQQAITEASQTNEALAQKVAAIEQAKLTLGQQATNRELADQAIPHDRRAVTFMNEMDLAIATNNLVVETLDYGGVASARSDTRSQSRPGVSPAPAARAAGSEKSLSFNLKLKGDYPGIRAFIERLENMPRLVTIDTMSVKRESLSNDGSLDSELTLIVDGEFYFFEEGATK